jgi:hypothetical protein
MKIHYKEPYWVKFQWDISEHHDNQYVTAFDKTENTIFQDFLHKNSYILTCNFKLKKHYKKDEICMVFGKPGKNLGLSYNESSKILAFEFWTKSEDGDKFNMVISKTVTSKDIENGVTISIVRDVNRISIFKNFEFDNTVEFDGNLVDDYKDTALFIGCSNPDIESEKHRYYCEVDINHLSFITNSNSIEMAKEICENETHNLPIRKYYEDILFYYDFKTVNNIGIVYDESKYTNFLEKVPTEYVK